MADICITNYCKPLFPCSFRGQGGKGVSLVKVGENCRKCKYYGGEWTGACNYCLVEHHSRVFEDGKRTVPSGYCDKFMEGRVTYDATRWKNKGVIKKHG